MHITFQVQGSFLCYINVTTLSPYSQWCCWEKSDVSLVLALGRWYFFSKAIKMFSLYLVLNISRIGFSLSVLLTFSEVALSMLSHWFYIWENLFLLFFRYFLHCQLIFFLGPLLSGCLPFCLQPPQALNCILISYCLPLFPGRIL